MFPNVKPLFEVALIALLLTQPAAVANAQEAPATLTQAISRAAANAARPGALTISHAAASQPATSRPSRNWFQRHPVLAGAAIGALGGGAAAYAKWGGEGTFVGIYAGGGCGALVGWLVSR